MSGEAGHACRPAAEAVGPAVRSWRAVAWGGMVVRMSPETALHNAEILERIAADLDDKRARLKRVAEELVELRADLAASAERRERVEARLGRALRLWRALALAQLGAWVATAGALAWGM
ncbi:MAG: hypothetical protein Tsb0020_54290 [Haliangiales bacterium]